MKKSLLTIATLLSVFNVIAQTNILKDTGNVGIGTLTPDQKLEISTNGASYMQLTNTWDVLGTVGAIKFSMAGSEVGKIEAERTSGSGRQTALKFFVKTQSNLAEAMRISEKGNVGIGTSNPRYTLHSTSYDDSTTAAALLWGEYYGAAVGVAGTSSPYYAFHVVSNVDSMGMGRAGGTKSLLYVRADGNVGIGTTNPQAKLAVNGEIFSKRVKVTQEVWADFVFDEGYRLPGLSEVENYIKNNKHLPEIPSAAEVEKEGLDVGEMNRRLLQKVEELTLYLIDQQKQITALQEQNKTLLKFAGSQRRK